VPPAGQARITAAARAREFGRGEMLYIEGDPIERVMLLVSGCVKLTQSGMRGCEVILRVGAPGDVLGAERMLSNSRHRSMAHAFRPCKALVWDASAFKSLGEQYPVLHQNMARILGNELLELEERFREVATDKAPVRIARQILRLAGQIGRAVNGGVDLALSREELGQMTGTTLFTVSRALSAWQAQGIVVGRREGVTVCDAKRLGAISG
jgi:CRP-like cAMP-binding protein